MKGLLRKDFAYLFQNKIIFAFLLVFGIVYSIFYKNIYFILGYYSVFAGILTLSTLNYDDFNHGLAFILTLPTTRRQYVKEKYCLGFLLSLILCLIATALAIISQYQTMQSFAFIDIEWLSGCLLTLLFSLFLISLLIPAQVKLNSEKSQYAMFIVFGTLTIIILIFYYLLKLLHIDIDPVITSMMTMNPYPLIAGLCLLVLISLWISLKISTHFIENKEF
ncbi:ABC-2 transporter permease [[Clostridium] spiroforme]|nr:ABC-2 transporter permease [Thomasclavelia spiroformis]